MIAGVVRAAAVRVEVLDGNHHVVATGTVRLAEVGGDLRVGYFLVELPETLTTAVVIAYDRFGREVARESMGD